MTSYPPTTAHLQSGAPVVSSRGTTAPLPASTNLRTNRRSVSRSVLSRVTCQLLSRVTCHEPDVDLELEARHGEGGGGGGGAVGRAGEHSHQVRPGARHRRHPAPATQSDTDIFNIQCKYFPPLPDELRRGGDQLAVVHSEAVPQGVALRPQPQARVRLRTNHSSVLTSVDQSEHSIAAHLTVLLQPGALQPHRPGPRLPHRHQGLDTSKVLLCL